MAILRDDARGDFLSREKTAPAAVAVEPAGGKTAGVVEAEGEFASDRPADGARGIGDKNVLRRNASAVGNGKGIGDSAGVLQIEQIEVDRSGVLHGPA